MSNDFRFLQYTKYIDKLIIIWNNFIKDLNDILLWIIYSDIILKKY